MKTGTLYINMCKEFTRLFSKLFLRTNNLKSTLRQEQIPDYRDFIENTPDIVCRVDKKLSITYINPTIQSLSGIDRQVFIGQRISDIALFGDQYRRLWVKKLKQVFSSREKLVFESACYFQSTTYYMQIYIHPIYKKDGSVASALCISRNITRQNEYQAELARLDRLNLIGKMAASIGHEVRNPMTTVRGFLQMLAKREENAHNTEYFKIMIEELDRANTMLTEFLSLAKNTELNLKQTNLNPIIKSIHPLINADALENSRNIKLELTDLEDTMLEIKEIRQLILNLVQNAIEASPPHSTITIQTFMEEDSIVLAIKDQGSGIPQPHLEKLGTPFFTTKEKGTGLGLSVCYSIAHHHKASISPFTGPDGTTFYIRFQRMTQN